MKLFRWKKRRRPLRAQRRRTTPRRQKAPPSGARQARLWQRRFRKLLHLQQPQNRKRDGSARAEGRERLRGIAGRIGRTAGSWLSCLALLAAVAAVPVGVWLGYRYVVETPHFQLREVVLAGNARVTPDDILAAAGLDRGVSTLTLPPDEIAAAITRLDWIRDARVEVNLPQTTRIEVTEREAVALVALGPLYMVDERGALFRRLAPREQCELPILTGFRRSAFTDPGRQAETGRRIRGALVLLRAWETLGLSSVTPLSEVESHAVYGYIARTAGDGTEIWLGEGEYGDKLARYADIVADLRLRGKVARRIYLDSPDALHRVAVDARKMRRTRGGSQQVAAAKVDEADADSH